MSVDDVLTEAKTRLEAALAPIDGGVGEDASYDEAFEQIKAELDRGSAIDGGTTDWSAVESKSYELLSQRSKDFRVALYYTAAATHTRKVPGLFDGVLILNELSNAFWEPMYPALKRPRARGALCAWLSEVATPIAQAYAPTSQEAGMAKALEQMFRQLDGFLADKLGEAYPGMMTLRDAVGTLPRRVPVEAPPPPPPPAAPPPSTSSGPVSMRGPATVRPPSTNDGSYDGGAGATTSGVGISPDEIVDIESAYRALTEVAPLVSRASDAILEMSPSSADGYRLGCIAAWLLVGGAPYNEGGQTQIDGPGEHVVQALNDLAAAQDWSNLLATAAQVAGEYPLLLDGPRMLALALENSGPDFEIAKNVIVKETAALVARAPELPTLTFLNGVPFASDGTKEWLTSLSAGGGGGTSKSPVDKAVIEADKLLEQGLMPQAIGLLSRLANQVSSPAQKFRARLEIAKACLRMQVFDIARAQLEALERVAEEHRLPAWDPELCAEMYANLYRARKAQSAMYSEDADLPKKVAQSLQQLTELDAAQALAVMQEAPV